ncbi:hypothetical protein Ae201684_001635 [Aphanomyces euteiches]|uniref:Uncharacterized protein n=1 Tax=Aphanomyces euteiches TaxID=100861 RepID=A0A6G0XU74_9STRA|nr:hypothetical protein Ae201684_001635 [Aphanomyces euteiches]
MIVFQDILQTPTRPTEMSSIANGVCLARGNTLPQQNDKIAYLLALAALWRAIRRPTPRIFLARFLASLICLRDFSTFSLKPCYAHNTQINLPVPVGMENTYADQAVLGFKLLGIVDRVVDQAETRALSTAESRAESIQKHRVRVGDFVHLGYLFLEFGLWHIRTTWVQDIHKHLAAGQQRVAQKLARTHSHRGFVRHFFWGKWAFTKMYLGDGHAIQIGIPSTSQPLPDPYPYKS